MLVEDSGSKSALPPEGILSMEWVTEARLKGSAGEVLAFRGNFAARPVEISSWLGKDSVPANTSSKSAEGQSLQSEDRWLIWIGSEERPVPVLTDRIKVVRKKVPRVQEKDQKILGYASLPTGDVASVLNPDCSTKDAA